MVLLNSFCFLTCVFLSAKVQKYYNIQGVFIMIIDIHNHLPPKSSPYRLPAEEYLNVMDEAGVDKSHHPWKGLRHCLATKPMQTFR